MGSKSKRQSRKPARWGREWRDRYYKQMFSHPEMVIDLLSGFVQPSRIDELDFSTLQPLPTNFVNARLNQRSGDCAWRVNFRDSDKSLIVLVEFQSTVAPDMVSRMWDYAGLQYADSFRRPGPWEEPEMVLIVLYSGTPEWTGSRIHGEEGSAQDGGPDLEAVVSVAAVTGVFFACAAEVSAGTIAAQQSGVVPDCTGANTPEPQGVATIPVRSDNAVGRG